MSQGSHLTFRVNGIDFQFSDLFLTKHGLIAKNLYYTFEKITEFAVI